MSTPAYAGRAPGVPDGATGPPETTREPAHAGARVSAQGAATSAAGPAPAPSLARPERPSRQPTHAARLPCSCAVARHPAASSTTAALAWPGPASRPQLLAHRPPQDPVGGVAAIADRRVEHPLRARVPVSALCPPGWACPREARVRPPSLDTSVVASACAYQWDRPSARLAAPAEGAGQVVASRCCGPGLRRLPEQVSTGQEAPALPSRARVVVEEAC